MRKTLCAAMLAIAAIATAQETPAPVQDTTKLKQALPEDARIEALANDLHAISRISMIVDAKNPRQVISRMIEQNIEALRIPRGDGTYEWAALQREEASRVTESKAVELVNSQETLNIVTVTAANAYRIEMIVPRKRNALLSNNRVYVRNVIVEATGFDGKTTRSEVAINSWINPGDTRGEALPAIYKNVKLTAEVGVESGDKKATVSLALLQAKLVDDPASPYHPAVRRLLMADEMAKDEEYKLTQMRGLVDEALLLLPGEMQRRADTHARTQEERKAAAAAGTEKGRIEVGDATPDVTRELQDVSRLLTGTLQEQGDARARLEKLINTLAPPVTANAPASTAPQMTPVSDKKP